MAHDVLPNNYVELFGNDRQGFAQFAHAQPARCRTCPALIVPWLDQCFCCSFEQGTGENFCPCHHDRWSYRWIDNQGFVHTACDECGQVAGEGARTKGTKQLRLPLRIRRS